jgi:hypothetical protein
MEEIYEEYTRKNGESVAIEFDGQLWTVANWDSSGNGRWLKTFKPDEEDAARKEYERWRD